jgi:hypothetical protein
MNAIDQRQAYRYNVQFKYSVVDISCESFIEVLPVIGVKNAFVTKSLDLSTDRIC